MPKKPLEKLEEIEKRILAGALDGLKVVATEGKPETIQASFLSDLIRGKYGSLHPRGLEIEGFVIQDVLDLEYCNIHTGLTFISCTFMGSTENGQNCSINLLDSRLAGLVLKSCKLKQGFFAERAQVSGSLFIRGEGSKIDGELCLALADIRGNLDLSGTRVLSKKNGENSTSRQNDAQKNGKEDERYAIFADGLHVNGNVLFCKKFETNGGVKIMGGRIGGNLDCEGGVFSHPDDGYAFYGDGLTVKGSVKLNGTFTGKKGLSLLCADLGRILDMKGGKFGCAVNLKHAKTVTLRDDAPCWADMSKLDIDGFCYENFDPGTPSSFVDRRPWLEKATEKVFSPQPYEQLAKVQASMGLRREVRMTQIAKEVGVRGTTRKFRWRRLWSCAAQYTIGFGYAPWRLGCFLLFFWVVGSVIFFAADKLSIIVPAKERIYMSVGCEASQAIDCQKQVSDQKVVNLANISSAYPRFNAFVYSLDTMLPFVDLKQEDYWLPAPRKDSWIGDIVLAYLWFHILCGWFLASMGVAGITGLVKKDG